MQLDQISHCITIPPSLLDHSRIRFAAVKLMLTWVFAFNVNSAWNFFLSNSSWCSDALQLSDFFIFFIRARERERARGYAQRWKKKKKKWTEAWERIERGRGQTLYGALSSSFRELTVVNFKSLRLLLMRTLLPHVVFLLACYATRLKWRGTTARSSGSRFYDRLLWFRSVGLKKRVTRSNIDRQELRSKTSYRIFNYC